MKISRAIFARTLALRLAFPLLEATFTVEVDCELGLGLGSQGRAYLVLRYVTVDDAQTVRAKSRKREKEDAGFF